MSKDKKPQAGEFWLNESSELLRIVGWSSGERLFYEHECGTVLTRKPANTDHWHHEPRCTGWDWQPEPEPEWFDLTPHDGHVLRKDVDWIRVDGSPMWIQCFSSAGKTIREARHDYRDQFRCLLKDAPKPATQTIAFHEVIRTVVDDFGNTEWQLQWSTNPTKDDMKTGRTETREVVR